MKTVKDIIKHEDMKTVKNIIYALPFAIGAFFLSACSSDGTLEAPAYKTSSALYEINQAGSALKSVQFTESGNYIIVRNSTHAQAAQSNITDKADCEMTDARQTAMILFSPWNEPETRSTTYNNIITGKFTKTDETTYVLEGFGTITVNVVEGTKYSLVITETGSSPYTLTAAKKEQYGGSDATDKLCRTWRIASMRLEMSIAGNEENISFDFDIDEEVDGGDLAGLLLKCYESMIKKMAKSAGVSISDNEIKMAIAEIKDDAVKTYPYVENMIFTQTGTYMVMYKGDKLGVATWTWTGDDFKMIHYSWDYNDKNAIMSGECSVNFEGKRCYLVETSNAFSRFADEGYGSGNGKLTYTLEEE